MASQSPSSPDASPSQTPTSPDSSPSQTPSAVVPIASPSNSLSSPSRVSPTQAVTTSGGSQTPVTSAPPVLPMTTPFHVADDCFVYTSAGSASYESDRYLSGDFRICTMEPVNSRFLNTTCFPSGIRSARYSAAVCPSGWVWRNLIPASRSWTTFTNSGLETNYAVQATSASCCPAGFDVEFAERLPTGPPQPCLSTVTTTVTQNVTENGTPTAHTIYSITSYHYPPMVVSWDTTDFPTISPTPPYIDNGKFVPRWAPGEAPVYAYDKNPSQGNGGLAKAVFITVIVVPIVLFIAILGCCICCIRARRRKEKREMAKELEDSEAAAAPATDASAAATTSNDASPADGQRAAGAATATENETPTSPQTSTRPESTAQPTGEASMSAAVRTDSGSSPFIDQDQFGASGSGVSPYDHYLKPHYPGLPSNGFDGIEEPPPYQEAAPSGPSNRHASNQHPPEKSPDGL